MMASVRFRARGSVIELNREQVELRLLGVPPEAIQRHSVRVNGVWYPVKQAFESATGLARRDFISHEAMRHLATLGFELHGEVEHREPAEHLTTTATPRERPALRLEASDEAWHTEAAVQATVVEALTTAGWRIISTANTATREHGIDIVAARGEEHLGIEVKGYPSRAYADPARRSETKRTQPSTQAGHWYSQAVLAAMRLRAKRPEWASVIALPDFPRYRQLFAETRGSLTAAGIDLWFVGSDGTVAAAFSDAANRGTGQPSAWPESGDEPSH